jgi:hypothetical protein
MRLLREPIDHATWSNWSKHCDHSAKHDPHLRCALHRVRKREVSQVWVRVEEPVWEGHGRAAFRKMGRLDKTLRFTLP